MPRLVGSIVLQAGSMREHRLAEIERSMDESMRFAVTRTIVRPDGGHARCTSSFVDQDGAPMTWHDFGCLEGPGWAANAVGGACGLPRGNRDQEDLAVSLLDHVLEDGFVDERSGFVVPYRDTATGAFCLNFKHNDEWLCPGSMARTGCQLLAFADVLPEPRRGRMQRIAARMAAWIRASVPAASNGWYPRRCSRDGRPFSERAEGGPDPLAEGSADGIFTVHLYLELARRGLADHLDEVQSRLRPSPGQAGSSAASTTTPMTQTSASATPRPSARSCPRRASFATPPCARSPGNAACRASTGSR